MKFGCGVFFALLVVLISVFVPDEAYAQATNFNVAHVDSVSVTMAWNNLDSLGVAQYSVETRKTGYTLSFPVNSGEYNATDSYHGLAEGGTANYTLIVYYANWSILNETTITVGPIPANVLPTADAGSDRIVTSGGNFTLDGSGSTDDRVNFLEYEWMQTAGPDAELEWWEVYGVNLNVIAPDVDENAILTFKLTVTDESNEADEDFVNVTVVPGYNARPEADAGEDREVAPGDYVTLNARDSTDDNTPMQDLNYSWQQMTGTKVNLSDPRSMVTSFTVPGKIASTEVLRFLLTVTDRLGNNGYNVVNVMVVPPENSVPTADAGDKQAVEPGDSVTLNGSRSSDPDHDSLNYSWQQKSGTTVNLSDYNIPTPNFTAPTGNPTLLVFELTVNDWNGSTSTDDVCVSVASHDPPVADAGPHRVVYEGHVVTLNASNTTYNHTLPLTYNWTKTEGSSDVPDSLSGETADFTVPTLGPDADQPTVLVYKLTVSDGVYIVHDSIAFSIYPEENPVAKGHVYPNSRVRSGETVTLYGEDSYDNQGRITGRWDQLSLPHVNLPGSGLVNNFTAPYFDNDTVMQFLLTVQDNKGNSDNATVNVTIMKNTGPTANAGNDLTVRAGAYVWIQGSGDDDENDALYYSWKQISGKTVEFDLHGAGNDITFNAPDTSDALYFELKVSDGAYEATDKVIIIVKANEHAPTANAGSDRYARTGDTVTLSGSGHDGDGNNITYSWMQTNGNQVTLRDSDTLTPSFTAPDVAGGTTLTLTFELTVSDYSRSGTDTVNVTILPSTGIPSAYSGENRTVRSKDRVDLNGTATFPTGSDVKYRWTRVSGPGAIRIFNSNRANAYFYAPDVSNETEAVFRFKTSAGELYSEDTVTITIRPNEEHNVEDAGGKQMVDAGDTVTLDANVTNPDNDPLTHEWKLIYARVYPGGQQITQAQKDSIVNAIDGNREDVSFNAPSLANGESAMLIFMYLVSDGLHWDYDFAYVYVYG